MARLWGLSLFLCASYGFGAWGGFAAVWTFFLRIAWEAAVVFRFYCNFYSCGQPLQTVSCFFCFKRVAPMCTIGLCFSFLIIYTRRSSVLVLQQSIFLVHSRGACSSKGPEAHKNGKGPVACVGRRDFSDTRNSGDAVPWCRAAYSLLGVCLVTGPEVHLH